MRGQLNSSITRVRPFFSALLAQSARRDSSEEWLAALLESVSNRGHLPETLRRAPGKLLPELAEARPKGESFPWTSILSPDPA